LNEYFPEREKQDVFPAASRDGFTAVRKYLFNPAAVRDTADRSLNYPG
jgi:hypothetical protein